MSKVERCSNTSEDLERWIDAELDSDGRWMADAERFAPRLGKTTSRERKATVPRRTAAKIVAG